MTDADDLTITQRILAAMLPHDGDRSAMYRAGREALIQEAQRLDAPDPFQDPEWKEALRVFSVLILPDCQ